VTQDELKDMVEQGRRLAGERARVLLGELDEAPQPALHGKRVRVHLRERVAGVAPQAWNKGRWREAGARRDGDGEARSTRTQNDEHVGCCNTSSLSPANKSRFCRMVGPPPLALFMCWR